MKIEEKTMNNQQKRRLRFLEEDKEMFGLTSTEEIELKRLKQLNKTCGVQSKKVEHEVKI